MYRGHQERLKNGGLALAITELGLFPGLFPDYGFGIPSRLAISW